MTGRRTVAPSRPRMAPRNHEGGDSPRASSSAAASSSSSSSSSAATMAPRDGGSRGGVSCVLSRLPPVPAESLALARAGASAGGGSGVFVPSSLPVSNVPRAAERYTGLLGEAFKRLPLLQVRGRGPLARPLYLSCAHSLPTRSLCACSPYPTRPLSPHPRHRSPVARHADRPGAGHQYQTCRIWT